MNEILKILEGIDKTEAESNNGWWETSIGAQFGDEKLNDIIFCFDELKAQRDELLEALEESLGFLEFAYRDIQMNDYSFNLLEETTNKVRATITKAKGE